MDPLDGEAVSRIHTPKTKVAILRKKAVLSAWRPAAQISKKILVSMERPNLGGGIAKLLSGATAVADAPSPPAANLP